MLSPARKGQSRRWKLKHSLPEIPRDGLQVWLCDRGSNKGQPARRNNVGARTERCTDTKTKEGGRERERTESRREKGTASKRRRKRRKLKVHYPE